MTLNGVPLRNNDNMGFVMVVGTKHFIHIVMV
jgi:hypothetical protein